MKLNLVINFMITVGGALAFSIAPLHVPTNGLLIQNEYIVMLNLPAEYSGDGSTFVQNHIDALLSAYPDSAMSISASRNPILQKYENGYAARLSAEQVQYLRTRTDVKYLEVNQMWHVGPVDPWTPTHSDRTLSTNKRDNWGLRRLTTVDLPLSKRYDTQNTEAEGVDVYIVDTGINIAHEDFEGRAEWGFTAVEDDEDIDGNGHGTHVASTVAGKRYGVAKKAKVFAVKVLSSDGYGSTSGVLAGINFVGVEHKAKSRANKHQKTVANMSLGGGKSRALEEAVDTVSSLGVHFAVAAGNENQNACRSSPAGSRNAVTVGATTELDGRAYFSNWGSCVDIFAPGDKICAAWHTSDTSVRCISGTSMASPHVAGVMALLVGDSEKSMSGPEMKAILLDTAVKGRITNMKTMVSSPNVLLHIGDDANNGDNDDDEDEEAIPIRELSELLSRLGDF